jgi:hypothetical protein
MTHPEHALVPHAAVLESILDQQIVQRTSARYELARCGCLVPDDPHTDSYDLCQYHEGMADGIDIVTGVQHDDL